VLLSKTLIGSFEDQPTNQRKRKEIKWRNPKTLTYGLCHFLISST
jgi:hypothetical protein